MKSYTVKEYAKENRISVTTARKQLRALVNFGAATETRCWQENPKKYHPTYSRQNLPGQWFNRYTIS